MTRWVWLVPMHEIAVWAVFGGVVWSRYLLFLAKGLWECQTKGFRYSRMLFDKRTMPLCSQNDFHLPRGALPKTAVAVEQGSRPAHLEKDQISLETLGFNDCSGFERG